MKTILIIGGYGQFGGRLSERLSNIPDIKVLVAGRTLSKAKTLCEKHGGNLRPYLFDTGGDLGAQLKAVNPFLVIDAAGPFQSVFQAGCKLPKACIKQGCHYIDLSDSGTFTQNITALDKTARAKNIAIISGASSVPALSSAVVDAAQKKIINFISIEGGISPGGEIDIGKSVTQAVLSYLGKPLKLFRGGVWTSELGYSGVHKHTISIKGEKPIRRTFGLCDAPDLVLFPQHYKGVKTVRFYGSQELWIIHISLRMLAWAQKIGLVKNLRNGAGFFQRMGTWLGMLLASERGGMYMALIGEDKSGAPISQNWHLIASDGDGPYIPTLAAEILVRRWLAKKPKTGARPALSEISLAEFEAAFNTLAIKSKFSKINPAPTLYQQVLGPNFTALPPLIQEGHEVWNFKTMAGRVEVIRGTNPFTNILASIIGFAKTKKDAPISITMDVKNGQETWTRTIDGKKFKSVLSKAKRKNEIFERFGPIKFKMLFRIEDDKLHYDIISASIASIPFPKTLLPKSITHERVENGKFVFDVDIRLPLLGRLIAYKGWLK